MIRDGNGGHPCHRAVFSLVCALPCLGVVTQGLADIPNVNEQIVRRSRSTGLATFVSAAADGPIWIDDAVTAASDVPIHFLREQGHLFGVSAPESELVLDRTDVDHLGFIHSTFRQVYRGVPVFGGELKIHQRDAASVVAANGDFFPIKPTLNIVPTMTIGAAVDVAADAVDCGAYSVEKADLVIVDPGWYGDPPIGEHLAYYIVLLGEDDTVLRQAFFVDAHNGRILDQWDLTETALFRSVYDADYGISLCCNSNHLMRNEGDPPVLTLPEMNRAYDWGGDVYRFLINSFGYDSIDGAGMDMLLTVRYLRSDFCPNAFWNGTRSVFCSGTVADDVLAHEVGHGVTEFTAGLIYQNQSGQLNESYSDIWGELVDLSNGNALFYGTPDDELYPWPTHPSGPGTDVPNWKRTGCASSESSVRWLIAEDATAFGRPIRDMWAPSCSPFLDPDRANSPYQTCPERDNGGVHSGSGIPNHAFAMLSDGKTFNGFTITPIGSIKAAAVWFRALTVYLTPSSDFTDAFWALTQAAADLVDTMVLDPRTGELFPSLFTASDAFQVYNALLAVEMNTDGLCGATVDVLDPTPPQRCEPRALIYQASFESGADGWTVSNTAPTPYDWELVGNLPLGRAGTAFFCADPDNSCDLDESGMHLLISPVIQLPSRYDRPKLEFTHYVATEAGWDGGNLRISVNGLPFEAIPPSAISFNRYNTTLVYTDNTNPLRGQAAWSGAGGGWGTTVVDLDALAPPGATVQFQFVFGKNGCSGVDGWYVDDVIAYTCVCGSDAECDDGVFCNGGESCVDGFCEAGSPPCPARFCLEDSNECALEIFADGFESGTSQSWTTTGPDNTATSGQWTIGDPNGTFNPNDGQPGQPEDAYAGSFCAFTALNDVGTGGEVSFGGGDVDGGAVFMVSPTIDLTDAPGAALSYVRWFYNRDGAGDQDPEDWFTVDVSDDDGATWTTAERIEFDDPLANTWTPRTISLDGLVAMNDSFRLRFGASDGTAANNVIEAAVDEVRVMAISDCLVDADCDDADDCTIDTCVTLSCSHTPAQCVTITGSIPASGSIDARQPHLVDNAAVRQGWDTLTLIYTGSGEPAAHEFTLSEVGGDGLPPAFQMQPIGPGVTSLVFDEPLEPGTWTLVTHNPTGWQACLGTLPGDVNGNRLTSTGDIGALIDAMNGVLPQMPPASSTDIDHSGITNAQDLLRLIDLLNGAGAFEVWITRTLPPNPCG